MFRAVFGVIIRVSKSSKKVHGYPRPNWGGELHGWPYLMPLPLPSTPVPLCTCTPISLYTLYTGPVHLCTLCSCTPLQRYPVLQYPAIKIPCAPVRLYCCYLAPHLRGGRQQEILLQHYDCTGQGMVRVRMPVLWFAWQPWTWHKHLHIRPWPSMALASGCRVGSKP